MKIKKLIGALVLSLALLGGGYDGVSAQENDLVSEDDAYDSTFSGPLIYCVRADSAAAKAGADAEIQPLICDNEGKLYTTAAGGSGGAVTNAGVFAVQEDGAALTAQQAIQTAVELIDNLVHNIDDAVGATDAVIGLGCKHQGDTVHLTTAEDDYDIVRCSNFGAIQTQPEQHHVFDALDAVGSWLVLDDATVNFTTTKKHVLGTDALIFDKTNGSGTFAAVIDQTITTVDIGNPSPHDLIQTVVYIPDLADVAYVFVRLGTSDSAYNEWRIPDDSLTAATFETLIFNIGDASHAGITGNGWNPSAITYIALGVQFDGEDDALVGIIFDELSFHTNQHTAASIGSEVSTEVSTPNINLLKVGNKVVNTQAGNTGTGTQRITIATDDVNLAAIKTAVEGTITVDLAGNNDVVLTAGLLHADSPTTVATIVKVFNAGDIAATSMGASTAITISGTGALTKVCVILTTGTITTAENGDLIFFTTDPTISENTADLTVVKAKQISSIISLTGTDFTTDFTTTQINCQKVDEPFTALTHVLWHAKGATAYTDEVIDVLVTYRRDS